MDSLQGDGVDCEKRDLRDYMTGQDKDTDQDYWIKGLAIRALEEWIN